ncbi:polyubiquitin-B-like [Glandiceps talaboti]
MEHSKEISPPPWKFRQESYGFIVPPKHLIQKVDELVDDTEVDESSQPKHVVIPVTIRTQYGEQFTLKVHECDYVYIVKSLIEGHTEIDTNHQRMTYRGQLLEDEKMLFEYGIEKEAVLNIYRSLDGMMSMTIIIRSLREEDTTVHLEPLSTILEAKQVFEKMVNIPADLTEFVYMGQILNDSLTLYDYEIMSSSVIYVVYRHYPIIVKTLRRRSYQISVNPTTTVWEIKAKIYENEGIAVNDQHLVFGGREMFDDYDLHFYSATKPYSTMLLVTGDVDIVRKENGKFSILQQSKRRYCVLQ